MAHEVSVGDQSEEVKVWRRSLIKLIGMGKTSTHRLAASVEPEQSGGVPPRGKHRGSEDKNCPEQRHVHKVTKAFSDPDTEKKYLQLKFVSDGLSLELTVGQVSVYAVEDSCKGAARTGAPGLFTNQNL